LEPELGRIRPPFNFHLEFGLTFRLPVAVRKVDYLETVNLALKSDITTLMPVTYGSWITWGLNSSHSIRNLARSLKGKRGERGVIELSSPPYRCENGQQLVIEVSELRKAVLWKF
jgi:hypothetical protein